MDGLFGQIGGLFLCFALRYGKGGTVLAIQNMSIVIETIISCIAMSKNTDGFLWGGIAVGVIGCILIGITRNEDD